MNSRQFEAMVGRKARHAMWLIPFLAFGLIFGMSRLPGSLFFWSFAPDANPFERHSMYVDPMSSAAQDAVSTTGPDKELLQRIARIPTAMWLKPEEHSTQNASKYVQSVVHAAEGVEQLPVFVVYGITDRDCVGGYSSGGLESDEYLAWVQAIAQAMDGSSVVILEPDALATVDECGERAQRLTLLSAAVGILARSEATTYIDAGHSSWTPPEEMIELLRTVGVAKVRGFSTNVAGYENDSAEKNYADTLSRHLNGSHFIMDSGRNGNGSDGNWCNPAGRALGIEPGWVKNDTKQDAYVWVKPPGESDGSCGGSPPAGQWWRARAVDLATDAGW